MWDKVEPQPNVRISVPAAQHKFANLRQLIQASSRAGPDLTLVRASFLTLEALLSHEIMDLLQAVCSQVQSLFLLSMLVEEYEIRVVMRNEVYFQSKVCVSVAGLLDEAPCLR